MMSRKVLLILLMIWNNMQSDINCTKIAVFTFNCQSAGRFADANDPTCKDYFLCLHSSTYLSLRLTCPRDTFFDQQAKTCTRNFSCLKSVGDENLQNVTLPNTATETSTIIISFENASTTTRDSSEFCDPLGRETDFSCEKKGRYRNPKDPTCQTYYLCNLLRNGSFVQTQYKCPETSYFNPPWQVCDINYKCPCGNPATISTTEVSQSTTSKPTSFTAGGSTDHCIYSHNSTYFTCSKKGRYPNLNDPTCRSYYLCISLRNELFLKTKLICPRGSYFDPSRGACDLSYSCPCNNLPTTIKPTTVRTTTEEKITTGKTSTELSTSPDLTTTSTPITVTTTADQYIYVDNSAYFTCGAKGRYPNLNDPSCRSYYLCNLLRNGSFLQTPYVCPQGSFFDPSRQVCDLSYRCPCNSLSTTITQTTVQITTEERFTDQSTTDKISSEFSTSPDLTTTSTPFTVTTTADQCIYVDDPAYFTCGAKGRYLNLNDPSCRSYYLCNLLRNGSFLQTPYVCPRGSFFDPSRQVCDLSYRCPCNSLSTTITPTTVRITTEETFTDQFTTDKTSTEFSTSPDLTATSTPITVTTTADQCIYVDDPAYFTCGAKGRYPNLNDPSCRSYYLCNLLRNGSFLQTPYVCPRGSFFDPSGQVCDLSYRCPCNSLSTTITPTTVQLTTEETFTDQSTTDKTSTEFSTSPDMTTTSTPITVTTTADQCIYVDNSAYFTCGAKGRYPNLNDPSCRSYYLCNSLRNGSFLQTPYVCPQGSFFDPSRQVCDLSYRCPCNSLSTTITQTTVQITTEERFTDQSTTDKISSEFSTSPDLTTTSSPFTVTTTADQCIYVDDPAYFTCGAKGRYLNLNDPSCRSYYLCNLLRNGSFLQTPYICPRGSFFDPSRQVCDLSYRCPCNSLSTTITPTTVRITTEETFTDQFTTDKTSTEFSTSPDLTTTSTPITVTTTADQCIYVDDPAYFTCGAKGRYPNLNDPSCRSYYLCNLLRNGSFLQTPYVCPRGSLFDPSGQVCDLSYRCPCNSLSTTITPTTVQLTTEETFTDQSTTDKTSTEFSTSPDLTTTSTPITVTTTADQCIYVDDPAYFTCGAKGRYPNLNDPSCRSYYLCNLLRNGSFLQTPYVCPRGSFFDPSRQVCDLSYRCPCNSLSTTITPTTVQITTEETFTDQSTTDKTSTEFSTSPDLTTTSTPITVTTTADQCIYVDDPAYFTCGVKGRYPNLNDPSCRSYYLCNLLRNGSFLQTPYVCPQGSFFDPPRQVCDLSYRCPCNSLSTTITPTTIQITTEETFTDQSTTDKTSTEFSTSPDLTTTSTPINVTTTADECIYVDDPAYFTCGAKGRYPNLNDPSCRSYYLCNLLRNGSFLQTPYVCPQGSFFDPPRQVCDLSYRCPCNSLSTTITPTTIQITTEETFTDQSTTDKTSTEFSTSPDLTTTSTPITVTTTADQCIYVDDPAYFTCGAKGRYPNLNDPSCRSYYLCNLLRNGSFLQTPYVCPRGSLFDPSGQVCDLSYRCPCNSLSTTITPSTVQLTTEETFTDQSTIDKTSTEFSTSPDLTTTFTPITVTTTADQCIYVDDPAYFTCGAKGRYPNLNDPSCRSYYLCNLLRNGSFLQTPYVCPRGSFFDPSRQVCDLSYRCPCNSLSTTITPTTVQITTEETFTDQSTTDKTSTEFSTSPDLTTTSTPITVTTTADKCIYVDDSAYFTCGAKGRYPNLNDPSCRSYYLCNLLRNGSFLQTPYVCPQGSFFDPPRQVCDLSYRCPCNSLSTTITPTTIQITTEETFTDQSTTDKTSTEFSTSPDLTTTSTPITVTTTADQCIYVDDPAYFTCGAKGRYPNLNDPSCRSYYLCILLRNGSFLQTPYVCPRGSLFDPSGQVCDLSYRCPCNSLSTTITPTTVQLTTEETFTDQSTIDKTSTEFSTSPDLTTTSTPITVTTTADQCIYVDDPAYFTCCAKGRYPNLNDPSCRSYYLCNLLRNGSFLQTPYVCPQGSFFDPPRQVCDLSYRCPCNSLSTTITPTTVQLTTEETFTDQSTTDKTSTEFSTSPDLTTTSTPITVTTTADQCIYVDDPAYFTCGAKGRYPNLNDPSCRSYYLCNLLRNGSFLQTPYVCPQGSFFDPPRQVCDLSYRCPCNSLSTTITPTTIQITTEETFTDQSTTDKTSTEFSTSPDLTTTSTPITVTTTADQCIYVDDPAYFTCGVKGRYPNLNDPSCRSYYLCNLLRNGSFLQTPYVCPRGSLFDPSGQVCDLSYRCPCNSLSTTITPTTVQLTTEETFTDQSTTDKTSTEFSTSPDLTTTSTPITVTTTADQCIYVDDPAYFTCGAKGRYPNLNDPSCRSYYLCNLLRNGSFLQTPYICPRGSSFDPSRQVCDLSYRCPCNSLSTTITPTTVQITTEETFIDQSTTDKTSTEFSTSPDLTTTSTPITVTTTADQCIYVDDPAYFTCGAKGRYPNLNDPSCRSYYLCNLLRNGSFLQTPYICPRGSFFDPPKQVCNLKYRCPCNVLSTTITSTTVQLTTEETFTDQSTTEKTSTEFSITSDLTTTQIPITVTTTAGQCIYVDDPAYFTCSTKGRYPNLNDPTCQSYYLCNLLKNGSFLQTPHTCPHNSFFDPSRQVCDVSYRCPCISLFTVTTPSTVQVTTEDTISDQSTTGETTTKSSITSEWTTVLTPVPMPTDQCIFVTDPAYFTCSTKGSYPNLNDPTCRSYYLCNSLKNDSFLQTLYTCPQKSFFDPSRQVCDPSYRCPCDTLFTTTTTTVRITTEHTTSDQSITDKTTTSSSTSSDLTTTSASIGVSTTTDQCIHVTDPGYFTCSRKGRYPNLNDPSCQSYYLCNLLRNGSFVQTQYKCPKTSYFNPPIQVCDVSYKCPCTVQNTTTPITEPVTPSEITLSTTSERTITDSITNKTSTTERTIPTTVADDCIHIEDPEYFTCSKKGRYPNLNDPSCQSYYLCNLLRNGSFVQTQYKCPKTSYFNPPIQVCDTSYKCPCEGK